VFPDGIRSWHVARWTPDLELVHSPHEDPDYRFRYVASELYDLMRGQSVALPRGQSFRRQTSDEETSGPFRFSALDPLRLQGLDPYFSVDDCASWNPLELLLD
jgi:hypothetical protein